MAQKTGIEWCDHTLNYWIGCTEVSPACDNCYARTMAQRYDWAKWGNHERRRTSRNTQSQVFKWNRQAAKDRVRRRVFINSLSDFCDNQAPQVWRDDALKDMAACEHLDFLILTKRPQNITKMTPFADGVLPWPNIWLGTTVENQEEADRRIPHLLAVPAIKHFLSCEPLLGVVDLNSPLFPEEVGRRGSLIGGAPYQNVVWSTIDWIICGGESGHQKRPMNIDWAYSLKHQCEAHHVPFFMKQIDKVQPIPADLMIRQFPP